MFPYRRTSRLGIAVEREQVGFASVSVRMQRHEQRIERAGGYTLRIKARKFLPRSVQPVPSGVRSLTQGLGQQVGLLLLGFLFD